MKYLNVADMQLGKSKRIRKLNEKALQKYLSEDIYNEEEIEISISGNDSYLFDSLDVRKRGALVYYAICIDFSKKEFEDNKKNILEKIREIFVKLNGVAGYIVSYEEAVLQNEKDINWFNKEGGNLEEVKLKKDWNNKDIIDVECNSGHRHFEKGVPFGAWWKMWFGKEYYQYIPRERLVNFQDGLEIKELENEALEITLYEDVWNYNIPKVKDIQWKFRDYTGMDEVAHRLMMEREEEPVDPTIEIETKNEDVRIIKVYLNENGERSEKSKASQVYIRYITKEGKTIKKETIEL